MQARQEMDRLQESILMLRVENSLGQDFIPETKLLELLTEDTVRATCKNLTNTFGSKDIADVVFSKGRKVFAILVLINHLDLIERFIQNDHFQTSPLDHKLPFSIEHLERTLSNKHRAAFFYKQQWEFCAAFFSNSGIPRCLDKRTILPYQRNSYLAEGGFGTIWDVEINDAHHGLGRIGTKNPSGILSLVRKEMVLQDKDHEAELQNLSLLKLLNHPNVVRLLCCYEHDDRIHLLFPKASEGDLGDLLASHRPSWFSHNESFLVALTGLASAIQTVHNFVADEVDIALIGCHHDLKTKNVLVDHGRFILADFGLSRFKPEADGSKTPYRTRNGYEIAPECQSLKAKTYNTIHRSSDIWSFGCIIAYVLAYMMRGTEGVESFKQARRFNNSGEILYYFHCGDTENQGMREWLQQLNSECSLSEKMALELVQQMLVLSPDDRPSARNVVAQLQYITVHALTQKICDSFCRFESMTGQMEVELFIEKSRFMSWQYALNLIDDQASHVSLRHLSGCDSFESTLDRLKSLHNLLESSDPLSANMRRRVILPFRQHNSSLLTFIDHSAQDNAKTYLETSLLRMNSTEYLQLLSQYVIVKEMGHMANTKRRTLRALSEEAPVNELELPLDWHTATQWRNVQLGSTKSNTRSDNVQYNANESCLIEWKKYDDSIRRDAIKPRIQAVASLLHSLRSVSRFRILCCKGYCHKPRDSAFGLIYSIPESLIDPTKTTAVSTLGWFLLQGKISRGSLPDLGTKLLLARALASTVLHLHNVSWLHRRPSTANIVFFHDPRQPLSALTEPYIIGLLHSRKNERSAFTEGINPNHEERDYLHPKYRENDARFELGFDYFSLGLILFEIGVWKPLREMIPPIGSAEKIIKELLSGWMPVLRSRAGFEYGDCVEACLNNSLLEANVRAGSGAELSDEDSTTAILLKFSESVVQKLTRLCGYKL